MAEISSWSKSPEMCSHCGLPMDTRTHTERDQRGYPYRVDPETRCRNFRGDCPASRVDPT